MKFAATIFWSLLLLSSLSFGQEKPVLTQPQSVRAIFKDKAGGVVPGLRFVYKSVTSEAVAFTDINGELYFVLSPGDHEIVIDKVDPSIFRAFLRVGNDALLPNSPEFVIDTDKIFSTDKTRPRILKFVYPSYPPAARAVRVLGEVSIVVTIDKNGKVISDEPINGSALLKPAARAAAKQFLFEDSESAAERKATLTFVFLPTPITERKKDLTRYENPYRLVVEYLEPDIQTNSTHGKKR